MTDPKKIFILKYMKEPKIYNNTHIRENGPLRALVDKLMEKYQLNSRQQVYELGVLSIGLDIPPEKLAPFIQKRTKGNSRKAILEVYEALLEAEL